MDCNFLKHFSSPSSCSPFHRRLRPLGCSLFGESRTEAEEADLWAGALSCFITYHQMEMVNPGVYERSMRDLARLGKEWTWLRYEESVARLQFVRVAHPEQSDRKSVRGMSCFSRIGES